MPRYTSRVAALAVALFLASCARAKNPVSLAADDARARIDGISGPKLHLFNQTFDFTYPVGGSDYALQNPIQVPYASDQSVTVFWDAIPAPQTEIARTRWLLVADGAPAPTDATPSWASGWAPWSKGNHSATVGPFADGLVHVLYVEVEDTAAQRSLGVVRLIPIDATRKRPLLIVDDTRFLVDDAAIGGGVRPPTGAWPTAAELDTFFYAIGGFPWNSYPAGTNTTPGLFLGYQFDTLGTRSFGRMDMSVPLETLTRYEHVIWIVDRNGAGNLGNGLDRSRPTTSLRYMTEPGHFNTLAAYVQQGGEVWLLGGGIARATLEAWDQSNTPGTYTNDEGTLTFGRMLYDQAHIRSGLSTSSSGRPVKSSRAIGGWPGAPDYGAFPAELRIKTAATDPLPPFRTDPNLFYRAFVPNEYISLPNAIVEGLGLGAGASSALDTLYESQGNGIPVDQIRPVMTLYHGADNVPVLYSGHDLWDYARADLQQLINGVLQSAWGLSPGTGPVKNPRGKAPVTVNAARPRLLSTRH